MVPGRFFSVAKKRKEASARLGGRGKIEEMFNEFLCILKLRKMANTLTDRSTVFFFITEFAVKRIIVILFSSQSSWYIINII